MVDETEILKKKNSEATVTSSGSDRFEVVVTCRLRTRKQTRMDDSATPEQLNWTADTHQAQPEDMDIKHIFAWLDAAQDPLRLEDVTPLRGTVRT